MNDAEFEESDDEEDVQRQRTGAASQKRVRLEAEESAPKAVSGSTPTNKSAPLPTPPAVPSEKILPLEEPKEPAPTSAEPVMKVD